MRFVAQKNRITALLFFLSCLLAQSLWGASIIYQEDSTTNFKNPERGIRNGNETLVRIYFELGSYTNADVLPKSVFDKVAGECAITRAKGQKIIPRFRYYSDVGTDAPLSRILKHIEQLGPVLRANSDVIALMEAGFIGCWGEWHHDGCRSTDVNGLDNTASQKAILFKLLDAISPDRMVVFRYNKYKRDIFGADPLGPDSAFSGSYRARTGAMNDCFRFNVNDRGTFDRPPYYTEALEPQKVYLSLDNRYVPQEGESCGTSSYSVCDSAIKDLKRMHWDFLASNTYTSQWASGGCLNYINMHYGYRIVLKSAILPDSVRPGYLFNGSISLQNVGWGKIYNARDCELVFRNTAPTIKSKFVVKLENDPRRWCMREDTLVDVPIAAPIPKDMPDGKYLVYLNLPDPYPSLHNRKEYSIRLANNNVWEDSTGYNSLLHTVVVSKDASVGTVLTNARAFKGPEPVRVKRQKGSIEFTLPGTMQTPVTLEIFTLSGAKVWSRTIMPRESRSFTWTGASSSVYLWKVSQKDNGPSHAAGSVIRSLVF